MFNFLKRKPKLIEFYLTESEALKLSQDLLPYNLNVGEYLQFQKGNTIVRLRVVHRT